MAANAPLHPQSRVAASFNKTDAGNGSYGICRVIDAYRSPSPDPRRSAMIKMQNYSDISRDFQPDGALRDFYISDVTRSNLQTFLDLVSQHSHHFSVDGVEQTLPSSIEKILGAWGFLVVGFMRDSYQGHPDGTGCGP